MSSIAAAAIITGGTLISGWMGGKAAKRGQAQSNKILQEQLAFQKEQQKKLDKQKEVYRRFKFENPYANVQTEFENVYEDLTVNQQQADFMAEQGAQQRADILGQLRGSAGGSGIAALAQAMANQGQLQARQISASIGQQESVNQKLMAQGARQKQAQEYQAEMQVLAGDAMVQEAEMSRQSTLLGVEFGGLAGANQAVQSAYANKMAADSAATQMQMQTIQSLTNSLSQLDYSNLGKTTESDRKLKKNINLIGKSPSGLNIYSFEYKDSKYGKGLFQGVMSDEIPQEAVETKNGYDTVDYSKLDVEFKQI